MLDSFKSTGSVKQKNNTSEKMKRREWNKKMEHERLSNSYLKFIQ